MSLEKNAVHVAGHIAYIALYGLLIISSILFYNWTSSETLLYAGWIVLAFGACILLLASQSRRKGHTTKEDDTGKETLVESGMCSLIRHPEFLGNILIIFGFIFIAQHWSIIVIATTLIILLYAAMVEEEKRNIEKFGDAYKNYMQKVPRINLVAGIIRRIRRDSHPVGRICTIPFFFF
jgi:protein-S-isoprenylcysteine O-methyltransferase Ste14